MTPKYGRNNDLSIRVQRLLLQNPGLSIKQIAKATDVSRHLMTGLLSKMEQKGEVTSIKIGSARTYFSREAVAK